MCTGANDAGKMVSSSAPLLRPDPSVMTSGHDKQESKIRTDVSQSCSGAPFPQPESVPADEDRCNVEVAAWSGPGREDKRARPRSTLYTYRCCSSVVSSTPSFPPSRRRGQTLLVKGRKSEVPE